MLFLSFDLSHIISCAYVRWMAAIIVTHKLTIQFKYISTRANAVADHLSRLRPELALLEAKPLLSCTGSRWRRVHPVQGAVTTTTLRSLPFLPTEHFMKCVNYSQAKLEMCKLIPKIVNAAGHKSYLSKKC